MGKMITSLTTCTWGILIERHAFLREIRLWSRHQDPDPTASFVEQSMSSSTTPLPPLLNRRLDRRLFIHRPLDISPYHLHWEIGR